MIGVRSGSRDGDRPGKGCRIWMPPAGSTSWAHQVAMLVVVHIGQLERFPLLPLAVLESKRKTAKNKKGKEESKKQGLF